jgi:hypothetical protein
MPKNMTGGHHKGRKNGEGNTGRKNREMVEAFISDIRSDGGVEQVHVARVLKRFGCGRMEVFYVHKGVPHIISAPIKGSLSGRGKKQAFITIGSVVLVAATGISGAHSHEIIAVLSDVQTQVLRESTEIDDRIFAVAVTDGEALKRGELTDDGIVFDYMDEVDIDAI